MFDDILTEKFGQFKFEFTSESSYIQIQQICDF